MPVAIAHMISAEPSQAPSQAPRGTSVSMVTWSEQRDSKPETEKVDVEHILSSTIPSAREIESTGTENVVAGAATGGMCGSSTQQTSRIGEDELGKEEKAQRLVEHRLPLYVSGGGHWPTSPLSTSGISTPRVSTMPRPASQYTEHGSASTSDDDVSFGNGAYKVVSVSATMSTDAPTARAVLILASSEHSPLRAKRANGLAGADLKDGEHA